MYSLLDTEVPEFMDGIAIKSCKMFVLPCLRALGFVKFQGCVCLQYQVKYRGEAEGLG